MAKDQPIDEQEMGFFDHLDVLRKHLFRSAIGTAIITIICIIYSHVIFDKVIFGPMKSDFFTYKLLCSLSNKIRPLLCEYSSLLCPEKGLCFEGMNIKLMNTELFGQFITQIKVAIVIGIILSFPYIIYEIWKFVRPALSATEAKKSSQIVGFSSFFFFVGVAFAYFFIVPFSLNFAVNYLISDQIQNMFTLENYIGFLTMMMLGCGLVFELPMIVYFLAKAGFLTAAFMRAYRRHALVVILILAAVITPSPDMFTMMIVAVPIYFLFEISILVAARVNPRG